MTDEATIELAREQGWVPQDEWKGPSEKWKPAEQFVEDGEQYHGTLKKKLGEVEFELQQVRTLKQDMETSLKKALVKEQKEKEDLRTRLRVERKRAFEERDSDAFDRADEALTELDKEATAPPHEPQGLDSDTQTWLNANDWYRTDPGLRAMADGHADFLRAINPHMTQTQRLAQVTEFVKTEAPHKFGKTKEGASSVETGGNRSGSDLSGTSSEQTYEALPPEAKLKCDEFVADKLLTKEEYVKIYYEQEEA